MNKGEYAGITGNMSRSYDLVGENYFDLFQDDILEHEYDKGEYAGITGNMSRCEDMLSSSFHDGELDGIISFYSVFHIPKEKTANLFYEFHRILKPGGKALIVTHKGDMNETHTEIWGHRGLSIFANFHLEAELSEPAEAAGFHIDEIYSREAYYPFPEERIIMRISKTGRGGR